MRAKRGPKLPSVLSVDEVERVQRHHISEKAIQNAMNKAVREAGIVKQASVHTLRHGFVFYHEDHEGQEVKIKLCELRVRFISM